MELAVPGDGVAHRTWVQGPDEEAPVVEGCQCAGQLRCKGRVKLRFDDSLREPLHMLITVPLEWRHLMLSASDQKLVLLKGADAVDLCHALRMLWTVSNAEENKAFGILRLIRHGGGRTQDTFESSVVELLSVIEPGESLLQFEERVLGHCHLQLDLELRCCLLRAYDEWIVALHEVGSKIRLHCFKEGTLLVGAPVSSSGRNSQVLVPEMMERVGEARDVRNFHLFGGQQFVDRDENCLKVPGDTSGVLLCDDPGAPGSP